MYESSKYSSVCDWFSPIKGEEIDCVCVSGLQQFWDINYVPKLEVVLTNWNVKESVEVVPTAHLADFDGKMIIITPPQHAVFKRFLAVHGKCFMYVNVIHEDRKRKVTRV